MSYAYTTTSHHFEKCNVKSVHRKWPREPQIELLFERYEAGGRRGDQITLHLDKTDAKQLCRGLLNIIDDDRQFHKELEQMMKIQRMPE